MPALVALRRYDWFIRWLEWLAAQLGDNAAWRGAGGMLFAIGPPLLLVALLQIALRGDFYGFPAFVFALVALFYAWGPRDLDHDVEAVVECRRSRRPPRSRRAAVPGTSGTHARRRLAGRSGVPLRAVALVRRVVLVPAARCRSARCCIAWCRCARRARRRSACPTAHRRPRAPCSRSSTGRSRS